MIVWVLLILAVAVALMIGIERLMARLGIRRAEPEPSPLAMFAERLQRWTDARRHRE